MTSHCTLAALNPLGLSADFCPLSSFWRAIALNSLRLVGCPSPAAPAYPEELAQVSAFSLPHRSTVSARIDLLHSQSIDELPNCLWDAHCYCFHPKNCLMSFDWIKLVLTSASKLKRAGMDPSWQLTSLPASDAQSFINYERVLNLHQLQQPSHPCRSWDHYLMQAFT